MFIIISRLYNIPPGMFIITSHLHNVTPRRFIIISRLHSPTPRRIITSRLHNATPHRFITISRQHNVITPGMSIIIIIIAIRTVIRFQPDIRPRRPFMIHDTIKREVMLLPANLHPTEHLCHRCRNRTNRRTLVEDTGIGRLAIGVAMEQPMNLFIREAKGILQLINRKHLKTHLHHRPQRCRLIFGQLRLLAADITINGLKEPPCVGKILRSRDQRPVGIRFPL